MAQTYVKEAAEATLPAQTALGTRAGIDAAILAARTALEVNSDLVLLSIDGIGAFDHIFRSEMLARLAQLPLSRDMLPFILLFYGDISTFLLEMENGETWDIHQGEGCEQGDSLMPLLFALGLDAAIKEASQELQEDELVFAFLDDVYLLVHRDRAYRMYLRFTEMIATQAGVQSHLGKTRCWGHGFPESPPGIEELGPDVLAG